MAKCTADAIDMQNEALWTYTAIHSDTLPDATEPNLTSVAGMFAQNKSPSATRHMTRSVAARSGFSAQHCAQGAHVRLTPLVLPALPCTRYKCKAYNIILKCYLATHLDASNERKPLILLWVQMYCAVYQPVELALDLPVLTGHVALAALQVRATRKGTLAHRPPAFRP